MLRNIDFRAIFNACVVSYGVLTFLLPRIVFGVLERTTPVGTPIYGMWAIGMFVSITLLPPILAGFIAAKLTRNRPQFHTLLCSLLGAIWYLALNKWQAGLVMLIPLTLTWLGYLIWAFQFKSK